jgi:prepilin-type N-terminal cleavage/methylation domain-containing protein
LKIENCLPASSCKASRVGKLKIAKHKGFTLIEMLVVIFVLGIGLIGALSFFNINLNNQFEAKQELIAAGLAQEASDLVRNIVDNNYLNGELWYNQITEKKAPGEKALYCSNIDRDVLFGDERYKCTKKTKKFKNEEVCLNLTQGVYSQKEKGKDCPTGEQDTGFKRNLTIGGYNANGICDDPPDCIDLDKGDCISVVASVTWNDRETKSTDIICKPRQ